MIPNQKESTRMNVFRAIPKSKSQSDFAGYNIQTCVFIVAILMMFSCKTKVELDRYED